MSFLVTARKYRPASFSEVVAQDHVVNTLLNAIKLGRVAHAYLFCGPRGVGKTTTARILAKALNCPNVKDGEPCNTCDTCTEITAGRCIDVIEIDGASNNGVDQVRDIRNSVHYMPTREKYKLYIIDEVHMLTTQAFNALLKTLEEPPDHAIFVFATTEAHKLPPTVISRCQRYDFRRIAVDSIVEQLSHICQKEEIEADEKALFVIARKADGSMRDAESIFDQVVGYSGGNLTYESVANVLHIVDEDLYFTVTGAISERTPKAGFEIAQQVVSTGHDIVEFLSGLEEHFRNILVIKSTENEELIESSQETRSRYKEAAAHFSEGDVLRLLKMTADAMFAAKNSSQPRLKLEIALVNMMTLDRTMQINDLLEKLNSSGSGGIASTSGVNASMAAGASSGAAQAREPKSNLHSGEPNPQTPSPTPSASQHNPADAVPATPKKQDTVPDDIHPYARMLMEDLGAQLLPES